MGTFQQIVVPTSTQLAIFTKQVIDNTFETVSVVDDGKTHCLPCLI
ncbi:MAG: hypothetical protein R2822_19560 [Spirosomataceae bacterium]